MWVQIQDKIINLNKVQYIDIVNSKKINLILNQKAGSFVSLNFTSKDELNALLMRLNTAIECVNLDVKPPITKSVNKFKAGDKIQLKDGVEGNYWVVDNPNAAGLVKATSLRYHTTEFFSLDEIELALIQDRSE